MRLQVEEFGKLKDGRDVFLITLVNKNGTTVKLTNYGATLVSVIVSNKNGIYEDVVLGYDRIEGYENDTSYFGSTVGRYANRIADGKFTLDGVLFQLECNDGNNHLHGGFDGFNKRLWTVSGSILASCVTFKLVSEDGDQHYPGTLNLSVTYSLNENNALEITYKATSDKTTLVNLTNHAYFNLSGDFERPITDHILSIDADVYTPVDNESIPTGELRTVADTAFDFITPKIIMRDIDKFAEKLEIGEGYDHNWVLNNYDGSTREVAKVYHRETGRVLSVITDQPGLQFYTANYLDGKTLGKNGIPLNHRTGLCLEAQYFPDAPNKLHFPQPILRQGEEYLQRTIYKFDVASESN